MADECAAADAQQQVLGPALDGVKALPLNLDRQILRDRPAQAPLTHHQAANPLALQVGRDTAPGGFDFR